MRKLIILLSLTLISIMNCQTSYSQLTGNKYIPGDYTTLTLAVADLNTQGVGAGGVTFNVTAGYTETIASRINLTATGTAANPIVFQKDPGTSGANPLITAYTGTSTPGSAAPDGIWSLQGADYVTISAIDLLDPNTTNPATMEYGYGLFKSVATNGCQYVTIRNCVVTLNRVNNASGTSPMVDGSVGILMINSIPTAATTVLTITAATGSNSNNKFYANTVQNCNIGFALIGFADVSPFNNADQNNDIGGTSALTGNQILNYGGGAAATNPSAAVRTLAQYGLNVSYNIVNNNNGSGVNHITTLRGIYLNTALSASSTISYNTITVTCGATTSQLDAIENVSGSTAASNTVNILNNTITTNYPTATTGVSYGIYNNSATPANLNINGNTVTLNTAATSGSLYALFVAGTPGTSLSISNNTIAGLNLTATTTSVTARGIFCSGGSTTLTANMNGNQLLGINYSGATGGTGETDFIYNSGGWGTLNLNSNAVQNVTNIKTTGTIYLVYNSTTAQNVNFTNNVFNNISRASTLSGSIYGYYDFGSPTAGTQTFSGNTISNIVSSTTAGTGSVYGIYEGTSTTQTFNVFNNIISGFTCGSGSAYGLYLSYGGTVNCYSNSINNFSTGASTIYGINLGSSVTLGNVYQNTINTLSSTYLTGSIYPVINSGVTSNIYRNKIYDIQENQASGSVYGIYVSTGTTVTIYNNLIGDLRTPAANASNPLAGIYVAGGSVVNVYYNSVYLNAASTGALFGSSSIYASTTPTLTLRDNIFVNASVPSGALGFASAYRRSSTTLTTYASTSNNNCFYAGTPGANNLIYYDGTNSDMTLAAFKTRVSPRDGASISENPPFLATTGTDPNFLHINTTISTQCESGGAAVAGITTDFDGDTRNASTPDIGADEFTGIPADLTAPGISYTILPFTCSTGDVTLSNVTISDATGVPVSGSFVPRIYYKKNADAYYSKPGTLITGNGLSGVWSFPITVADMGGVTGGDVISYFVIAQDLVVPKPNVGSNPAGVTALNVNSISIYPASPNTYIIGQSLSGTYNVGVGQTFATLGSAVSAYNNACSISGPITFVLTDAVYGSETFPITINASPYASATNTLTIKPSGNTTISGSSSTALIVFNGADYVTIDGSNSGGATRNLSLTNTYASGTSAVIHVKSLGTGLGATNDVIKNCNLTAGSNASSGYYGIAVGGSTIGASGDDNDFLTLQNNNIQKSYVGIYAYASATGLNNNLSIVNNTIGNATDANSVGNIGMDLAQATGSLVSGNTIFNLKVGTNPKGINISTGYVSSTVDKNKIYDIIYTGTSGYGGKGIDISTGTATSNLTISNNMISNMKGDGWSLFTSDAIIGIRIYNATACGGINLYYNSVYLGSGSFAGSASGTLSAALYIGSTCSNIDLRDNVLSSNLVNSNAAAAKTYAIYSAAANTAFSNINFNDYFVSGTQGVLGNIGAVDRVSLSDIVAGFGGNANSKAVDPLFTSPTDLHVSVASGLDASAAPIAGITLDFDGDTRDASIPDIGADEFVGVDLSGPTITYTPLTNTSSFANRAFTNVGITDLSGVNGTSGTRPRCYYKRSTDANTFNDNTSGTDGWKFVEANGGVTPFDFTIDYTLLNGGGGVSTGNTVQYFVVAQDLAPAPNVGINSGTFAAVPSSVNLAAANFPIGGTINSYQITGAPLSGVYTVGLAAFNRATGKDLHNIKLERKIKVQVPSGNSANSLNQKEKVSPSSTFASKESSGFETREVTEEYSELYDGAKKYEGSLSADNNDKKSSKDSPMGIYATITAAVTDLNLRGIGGAVTFVLVDASYPSETFPIQFNSNIAGISSSNTVTLMPNTGVTSAISGSVSSNALIRVLSSYVTIDGSNSGGSDRSLTIQNTSVTTPSVILIGSTGSTPISNVQVKNCNITNGYNGSSALVVSDAATLGNPGYMNTVTVQNNNISNAYIGVYVNAASGNNFYAYNNLLNTSGSTSIQGTGIYVQGVNGGTIGGNNVGNISNSVSSTTQRTGIWLATGTINMVIEKNTIHDISYTGISGYPADGIKISNGGTSSTGITVKNNMIYKINSDGDSYSSFGGTYSPIGIYCFGSAQTGISIYNNSIYFSGSTINFSGAYSIGICLDGGSVADIRNNLIVNNEGLLAATGAGAMCIACQTGNSQLTSCNNNDYYSNPPAGVKGLVKMGSAGADQITMSGVRTATTKDQLSFNTPPVFASATDLHIQASDLSVSGRGTYIAAVNSDYDGDARATAQSTTNRPVDVGADQYTPSGFTGNATVLNGSIYQDGGANGVEIVSGAFTTTGVFTFPGVRTPNNLSGKMLARKSDISGKDSKVKGSNQTNNKTNNNGQNDGPLSVNVPWIYFSINNFVITSSPVSIRFYYNVDQLATISPSNLEVAMWTGSTWEIVSGQTVNISSSYIQLSFDDWLGSGWPSPMLFALTDNTAPLPVTLCSFNASAAGRNINLIWKTCSEINNKGFNVERRMLVDPATNRYSEWGSVAFINGHGSTTEEHTYSYGDTKLVTGKYQYRLKQVDYNGNSEYFVLNSPNIVEIGKPGKADVSQNYPNPSNPKSKIDYQISFNGKVSIKIYDIIGKEVATIVNEVKEAGYYTAEFDGTNLASGVYMYRVLAEGEGQKFVQTKKMILVK